MYYSNIGHSSGLYKIALSYVYLWVIGAQIIETPRCKTIWQNVLLHYKYKKKIILENLISIKTMELSKQIQNDKKKILKR